jgi:hypothetical protein
MSVFRKPFKMFTFNLVCMRTTLIFLLHKQLAWSAPSKRQPCRDSLRYTTVYKELTLMKIPLLRQMKPRKLSCRYPQFGGFHSTFRLVQIPTWILKELPLPNRVLCTSLQGITRQNIGPSIKTVERASNLEVTFLIQMHIYYTWYEHWNNKTRQSRNDTNGFKLRFFAV